MSYYDDILQSVFDSTLDREITTITIDGTEVKGFFRRNEKDATNPYSILYLYKDYNVKQGTLFTVTNTADNTEETYIIFKCLTPENEVYRKYQCARCNQSIKLIFAKGDIVSYSCFETGFSDSLNTAKSAITVSSTDTFIFPLNDATKRITLNKRFLCGFYGQAWKVSDIQYINSLCYAYAVRDSIQPTDNTTDGIADYYQYYTTVEPITGDITVTPAYTETSAYAQYLYDPATTFAVTITGVSSPVWNITLNANGNPASYYKVSIDNSKGTFSVQTLQYSSNYLIFTISEGTTGKSVIYNIDLHSAF
jgi:hypothetical protein